MQNKTVLKGTVYRCIPNSSDAPLSTEYTVRDGGRWNAPGAHPVMYTFLSQTLARSWVEASLASVALTLNDAQPDKLPDLLLLECELENVANLTTNEGLME